jgi:membrane protease YdiL (CAAX protease family)
MFPNIGRFIGCSIALVIFSNLLPWFVDLGYKKSPGFNRWASINYDLFTILFRMGWYLGWIVIAFAFSRVRSIGQFLTRTHIDRRPTFAGWCLAFTAIGLAALDVYVVSKGYGIQHWPTNTTTMSQWGYVTLTIMIVLVSPFCEEMVVRGFLYPGIRVTYGIPAGICFVFVLETYLHWDIIAGDLSAVANFVVGTIILCLIRERTDNTMNCVLFHTVYNAVVIRQWSLCVVILGVMAFWCKPSTKPRT